MKKVISLWLFLYIPKIPQCKKASSGSFFRIYVFGPKVPSNPLSPPSPPSMAIFCGGTGSGKTNCLLAAVGHQSKWKPYKHIFLLSPNVEAAYVKFQESFEIEGPMF